MDHDLHIFVANDSLHDLRQVLQDRSPAMLGMLEGELLNVMPDVPFHVNEHWCLVVIY